MLSWKNKRYNSFEKARIFIYLFLFNKKTTAWRFMCPHANAFVGYQVFWERQETHIWPRFYGQTHVGMGSDKSRLYHRRSYAVRTLIAVVDVVYCVCCKYRCSCCSCCECCGGANRRLIQGGTEASRTGMDGGDRQGRSIHRKRTNFPGWQFLVSIPPGWGSLFTQ